jgi:cytochrome c-type protein NapB
MRCQTGEGMMKAAISRESVFWAGAMLLVLGTLSLATTTMVAAAEVPDNFDNQGSKLFAAQQSTPTGNLTADSGGRTLSEFYELRQYPGSPPRIPHVVDLSFSGNETDCLSCHRKGGYSPEFNAFAPVTPHPENVMCSQCHVRVQQEDLFVETTWMSISPPRLGQSSLPGSPPPIPHSLQLRENCIACHTGPGAVVEIRVNHASRGDCRQCHVAIKQSQPLVEFNRK